MAVLEREGDTERRILGLHGGNKIRIGFLDLPRECYNNNNNSSSDNLLPPLLYRQNADHSVRVKKERKYISFCRWGDISLSEGRVTGMKTL